MERKRYPKHGKGGKKGKGTGGTVLVALASVVLIALLVVLSPLGDTLSEKGCVPLFQSAKAKENEQTVDAMKQQEATGDGTATAAPTADTKQVTLVASPFYLLQMGAYSTEEAALERSLTLLGIGGAGYIFTDGDLYRVFAAGYLDETALQSVESQVRADGFECSAYATEQLTAKITLTGDNDALAVGETALTCLNETPKALCEYALQFDKEGKAPADCVAPITELLKNANASYAALQQANGDSLKPIADTLQKYCAALSTFLEEHDTIDQGTCAAQIKYLQLEVIFLYLCFFQA